MAKCKITVIERTINNGLANKYCQNEVMKCPCFLEGQEFFTELEKPNGFCDWAWNDILRFVTVLLAGGNFSKGIFSGWMKDESPSGNPMRVESVPQATDFNQKVDQFVIKMQNFYHEEKE
jgi:uncharacterized repeat protein (TIGR04076 family)